MTASGGSPSVTDFVAEAPATVDVMARRRASVVEAWHFTPDVPDAVESGLRRRARRQALALMLASSVITVLALYGVWTLVRIAI